MDNLPPEILILMLLQLPDLASLSAAIHASPLLHRAYLIAREQVLTNATLCGLSSRGIKLNEPCHWAEYSMHKDREGKPGFGVLGTYNPPLIDSTFYLYPLAKQPISCILPADSCLQTYEPSSRPCFTSSGPTKPHVYE